MHNSQLFTTEKLLVSWDCTLGLQLHSIDTGNRKQAAASPSQLFFGETLSGKRVEVEGLVFEPVRKIAPLCVLRFAFCGLGFQALVSGTDFA